MTENTQTLTLLATGVVGVLLTALAIFLARSIGTSNLFQKGFSAYQQQDYPEAEAKFRQVLKRHYSNDMAHLLLGKSLLKQGQFEDAIAQWQLLIQRSPKNVDAYLSLGTAWMQQGEIEKGIQQFKAATEKVPKSPEAYRVLGLAYREAGDITAAKANLITAQQKYAAKKMVQMVTITQQDIEALNPE
jgi:tetratricopeptide (TPR) repeat protein